MEDILSEKYAVPVLIFLYERGPEKVKKYDLLEVIGSGNTIDNLTRKLSEAGLITISQRNLPRKTFYLALTPEGRTIARQLFRARYPPPDWFFSTQMRFLIYLYFSDPGRELKGDEAEHYAGIEMRDAEAAELIEEGLIIPLGAGDTSKVIRYRLTPKGKKVAQKLQEAYNLIQPVPGDDVT